MLNSANLSANSYYIIIRETCLVEASLKARSPWLVLVLALTLLAPVIIAPISAAESPHPRYRPGRIWVRFKDGNRATLNQRARALGEGGPEAVIAPLDGVVLRVPVGQEEQVARRLAARSDVAYAIPIPKAHILEIPNDPGFTYQWALTQINAPAAWDVVTCSSRMVVAVVDTGIDLSHPDLASVVWTNPREIPNNGLDDDGNGEVDDVHGWHYYTDDSGVSLEDNNVQDDNGHGTHVSGIIAAATNNNVGIAGLAWGATIMPVKVVDSTGNAYWDDVIKGIMYATDNGARIINLSLGGPDAFAPLEEALAYAREHGVLVVAAAGNDGSSTVLYPAAYPEAMAVAATDSSDQRASFSDYGPQISVAAPGVNIYSTYWQPGLDTYAYMSGTSMAAPEVSGLAALVWARHPDYTPGQVEYTIEHTADDVNAATNAGWDPYLGWGRIDAARAVTELTPFPWVQKTYLPVIAR